MIRRISKILTPPGFEGDEQKNRAASLLNTILWTMFIGALLAIPLVICAPEGTMPSRLVAIVSAGLLALALIRLMHSGYVHLVSIVAVLGIWVVTNLAILFGGGGVRSIGFPGNVIVVLIAGILLGRRAALGATGLCIATGLAFMFARQYNMIPYLPIMDTDRQTLTVYSIQLIVAAVLLNLSLRNAESALSQAHQEIGERQRVQEQLRISQERFALAVEGSNDGIWDWDIRSNASYASPRWSDMLGYAPGELEHGNGMDRILSLMHPDDRERFLEANDAYLTGRNPTYEVEFRLRHKDGNYRWILSRGKALRDEDGQPVRMAGSHTDITERKRAEQVQHASRQIAEAALTQNLTEFYQSVYAIISPLIPARNFYITLYDGISETFTTPFLVDEFDSHWPPYRPGKGLGAYVLLTGKPLLVTPEVFAEMERQGQAVIINRSMVEWLGVPLKTREGKNVGVMAVQNYSGPPRLGASHMDLLVFVSVQVAMAIERMQAEAVREKLIQELTAKNTELERFTYTVSHDLKSPLITITGFLGLLEEDAASGDVEHLKHDGQRIREAVSKMQLMLDELLELSRIGRMMNPPEMVSFEGLVREALSLVHGRLESRGTTITYKPNLPAIQGDRQRLVEVLQNLIDNAAKFMGDQPEPRIEIGCEEQDGRPVFFVRDNGIGIDPKFHEQIFGLFNKLDPRTEGTGVGLALVKRIIEVHGGRIWVESEMGKGSTFYFTIGRADSGQA